MTVAADRRRLIPVVAKTSGWFGPDRPDRGLYAGLPVLALDTYNISGAEYDTRVDAYLRSAEFLTGTFEGWKKLFAKYWRDEFLKAAGRKSVVDPFTGAHYTEVYNYRRAADGERG